MNVCGISVVCMCGLCVMCEVCVGMCVCVLYGVCAWGGLCVCMWFVLWYGGACVVCVHVDSHGEGLLSFCESERVLVCPDICQLLCQRRQECSMTNPYPLTEVIHALRGSS